MGIILYGSLKATPNFTSDSGTYSICSRTFLMLKGINAKYLFREDDWFSGFVAVDWENDGLWEFRDWNEGSVAASGRPLWIEEELE